MKLKRTSYILATVVTIFGGILLAGGERLLGRITAPRIDPDVTPLPVTATATLAPTVTPVDNGWLVQQDLQSGQTYLTPPEDEEQALREAFAVILRRTRVRQDDAATLLTYDHEASIAQAQAYLADDFNWLDLDTQFVFVYSALGPENPIRCDDTDHCQLTRAVLGIQAVVILDEEMCRSSGSTPCLAYLSDDQIDARDNLVSATFRKDDTGVWKLTSWDNVALPEAPETW